MTLAQLIALFRLRADDNAQVGNRYTDEDATANFNAAEREACERAHLIRDAATADCCQLPLIAGQREYLLDARVYEVANARVRDQTSDLRRTSEDTIRQCMSDPGVSASYAVYASGKTLVLVLDRDPAVDGFLDMTVLRLPLTDMVNPDDTPEIAERFHMDLLHWALYLAYATRDFDNGSDKLAAIAEAKFEQAFGPKPDANVRRQQLRHRPPIVRPRF